MKAPVHLTTIDLKTVEIKINVPKILKLRNKIALILIKMAAFVSAFSLIVEREKN